MTLNSNQEDDFFIADILSKNKTIAMVGASKNWKRPSNFVMKYLQKHGYKVIPVNPSSAGEKILGQLCYSSLEEIPFEIDMVNIFKALMDTSADATPVTATRAVVARRTLRMVFSPN